MKDMTPYQRFVDTLTRKKMVEWCEESLDLIIPALKLPSNDITFRHAINNKWLKFRGGTSRNDTDWVSPTEEGWNVATKFLLGENNVQI